MANPFRKPNDYEAQPAESTTYDAPRAITAAADRIDLTNKTEVDLFKARKNSTTSMWQGAAWEYYDAIGEVKYAFNLVANIVARIRLFAAVVKDQSQAPVNLKTTDGVDPDLADAATRALARLDSAYGGQAGLLRDAALNLSVVGECYLVQVPERRGQKLPETWDVRSVDELQAQGDNKWSITPRRDLIGAAANKPGIINLPPESFVGRIWRPHARFSEEPDSSMRGLLDLMDELLLLNRTYRAMHRSRLNAGLLYIPDGISKAAEADPDLFADDPEQETPEEAADTFEEALLEAMSTPIEDESSAAAVVPLLVRGPGAEANNLKYLSFQRSFEDAMNQRYDKLLERILQGLDVPKDTVTGMANIKYSNAIQIDESLYKAHIEPMLLLIADSITVIYLRPYLISQGWSQADVERIVVWYDPSSVATRNDRAADADSGYDKKVISGETWRRAHGFTNADAPNPQEMVLRLLQDKATFTPDFSQQLLSIIAPDVMEALRQVNQATSVAPVPQAASDILNDGTSAPGAAPDAPQVAEPVAPDQDGPPFPLAEPTSATTDTDTQDNEQTQGQPAQDEEETQS